MSSATEDRLIAALAARADQVQPEMLRAPEVPQPPRAVTFLRRPAAYAVGIAAAAAAIAAPFVIGGLGSHDDAPVPPTSQSPSPQPDIGGGWQIADRAKADLDGDGVEEQVRLRTEPGKSLIGPRVRVEADLSGGESVFGILDSGEVSVNVVDQIQADGDAGQELVLNRDPLDGLTSDWVVVDLVGGYLVEPERVGDVPLSVNDVPDPDDADLAFQTDRWIGDGDTLYSSRSARSFPRYGMSFELPDPYVADIWAWQVVDGQLTAVPQDQLCISTLQATRKPCTGGEGEDLPAFFPESTDLIDVGESFTADVDFDGQDDTISLEGTVSDGSVDDGDVVLVVSTSSNGEKRLPIPAGWAPQVYATTIQIGMVDGLSLLVSQEGGDSSTLTYVATGAQGFGGDLIAAEASGAPFGSGFLDDGTPYDTWVGADDRMYTSVGPALGESPTEAASRVYVWTLEQAPGGTVRLAAVDLGTFCFNYGAGPVEAHRCDA